MNKETAKQFLPLVQAYAEGKTIQIVDAFEGGWKDYTADRIIFDGPPDEYRIKPEPREIWVNKSYSGIIDGAVYESEAEAKSAAIGDEVQARYREVLE